MTAPAGAVRDPAGREGRRLAGFALHEARLVLGTSAVYALRMLGVYMAMPVLSPYAEALPGSTPLWVGLAVGAYGLTQALFQVPFGVLGDRVGRGRVLALGLAIFGLGSLLCARATTAPALVGGRLLQGAGAMASTMIALLGDRTRPEVRTRAMAGMGVFLGGAFAIGLVAGPAAAARVGVPALFAFAAAASALGLVVLPWTLGGGPAPRPASAPQPVREAWRTLGRPSLLALDLGILVLHLGLTALFVVLPLRLGALLEPARQWLVYAPALAVGFLSMGIASHLAESPRRARWVLAVGSGMLATGFASFALAGSLGGLLASLCLYVAGFAALEPALAAQVTRHADTLVRGTAAGVFNTVQFFGVFLGGLLAGTVLHRAEGLLFVAVAATQLVWLALAWRWLTPAPGGAAGGSPPRERAATMAP